MELENLVQDEALRQELEAAKDLAEVAAALRARGLEVSEEELQALTQQAPEGELDEAALEQVAGGRALGLWRFILPILPLIPRLLPKPSPIAPPRFKK